MTGPEGPPGQNGTVDYKDRKILFKYCDECGKFGLYGNEIFLERKYCDKLDTWMFGFRFLCYHCMEKYSEFDYEYETKYISYFKNM